MTLESMSPHECKNRYLEHVEVAPATRQEYGYRLNRFIEFCEERSLDNLNDLTGRFVMDFSSHRRARVKAITVKGEIDTLRDYLRYAEKVEACPPGLADKCESPTIVEGDDVRKDYRVSPEAAKAILDYLGKYEYASFRHISSLLMWRTGVRVGTLRSFDLEDFRQEDGDYLLYPTHRPEMGTPLKNKEKGERPVLLRPNTGRVITDYIRENRHDVTDEYVREPLLTTAYGRPSHTAFRRNSYLLTRPCAVGGECPEGRDPNECEAVTIRSRASRCPVSCGPHAWRRGHVTHMLTQGVREDLLSGRVNMSPEIMRKHYDDRNAAEKIEAQRTWLPDTEE